MTTTPPRLHISKGNRKMLRLAELENVSPDSIVSVDLAAGYSCPAARICQTYAHRESGKITRGPHNQVDCYAAMDEAYKSAVRENHHDNLRMILACRSQSEMEALIDYSLPAYLRIIRPGSSGDFVNRNYYHAWLTVAESRPNTQFFAYTKNIYPFKESRPSNFYLTYSYGGDHDAEAHAMNLPACHIIQGLTKADRAAIKTPVVVNAYSELIPLACFTEMSDDFYFIRNQQTFGILEHKPDPIKPHFMKGIR